MKTRNSIFLKFVTGVFMLATMTRAGAQSTWDYTISDAGDGNSRVTWTVSGTLATPPGGFLTTPESSLAISVIAPGIYANTYSADGTAQAPETPDGSYFQMAADIYFPIVQYSTDTAAGNGNESFGLVTPLIPVRGGLVGVDLLYNPGTQSVEIPVSFSDFNPGTYESTESVFSAPLIVNLTVVPEPSLFSLVAVGVLGIGAGRRRFVA